MWHLYRMILPYMGNNRPVVFVHIEYSLLKHYRSFKYKSIVEPDENRVSSSIRA